MKWTTRVYKFIIDLFYPNCCAVCGEFIEYDKLICQKCIAELPYIDEDYCEKCGKHNCMCKRKIYYDKCFSFVYYKDKGKDGIMNLKLNCGVGFAEYFADYAVDTLEQRGLLSQIDVITAVPTTREKLNDRGYNQAYEYAKYISKITKIPVSDKLLVKTDKNLSQHELDSKSREKRSFDAYRLSKKHPPLKGTTVLLCDDIITTGSTLNACAKQLKSAGVERVICITIANRRYSKVKENKE